MKKVLNVGGNSKAIPIPDIYKSWDHILLDIDPVGKPDIVCDARSLEELDSGQFDAVYCSHNLEHYYKHEIPKVLAGFKHVLKPGGFVDIRVPDIKTLMQTVVDRDIEIDEVLYQSRSGPIMVHDVLYGYGRQMELSGQEFYAHKMGFSSVTLAKALWAAGLPEVYVREKNLEVQAIAFVGTPDTSMLETICRDGYSARSGKVSNKSNADTESEVALGNTGTQKELKDRGEALQLKGKHLDALAIYEKVSDPGTGKFAVAFYLNFALALTQDNRIESALKQLRAAEEIEPLNYHVSSFAAKLLTSINEPHKAAHYYCIAAKSPQVEPELLNSYAVVLHGLNRTQEAIKQLQDAIVLDPENLMCLSNLGMFLAGLKQHQLALSAYNKALEVCADFIPALINKASLLASFNKLDEAIACYEIVLEKQPTKTSALLGKAQALEKLRRHGEALSIFKSLPENWQGNEILGAVYRNSQSICDWSERELLVEKITTEITQRKHATQPFTVLSVSDSADLQHQAAEVRASTIPASDRALPAINKADSDPRITIAYMSGEFRAHAVMYLMAGIFEHHDREKFKVIGISLFPVEQSKEVKRITKSCEGIYDIFNLSHYESAAFIRDLGVDILIDLTGYTGTSRTEVLAMKPAAIQINYLGYPGTMGASFMDYIIADSYLIPKSSEQHYSESTIKLSSCFQANDDRKKISEKRVTRAAYHLPEDSFIFCSFNNINKLNPQVFACWLKLLKKIPDSVLWIFCRNDDARDNLINKAKDQGISDARLIFCGHEEYSSHLRRLQLADLALDTFPFNGGTTTSDALWAGLPTLTCSGEAFSSRMAGSLLNSLGLTELITNSMQEYEAKAVDLATNPGKLKRLRKELERQRDKSPVYDTLRICRDLEAAYLEAWNRHIAGQPPSCIELG